MYLLDLITLVLGKRANGRKILNARMSALGVTHSDAVVFEKASDYDPKYEVKYAQASASGLLCLTCTPLNRH